jgi:CBS domain-containing protein
MKAADVMIRNVVSIKLDSSVFEAAQHMILNRISGLPVLHASGKLVGVVTEGDLLCHAEAGTETRRPSWLEFFLGQGRLATEYVCTHGCKIRDVMTSDPQTIVEETSLDEIVVLMEQKRIKRLPVMRGDKMVGIVSRANLVQALASLARQTADTLPSDAATQKTGHIGTKPSQNAGNEKVDTVKAAETSIRRRWTCGAKRCRGDRHL